MRPIPYVWPVESFDSQLQVVRHDSNEHYMGPGLRDYAANPEEYQIFTPMDFAHDNCQYRGTGHVYRYAMEYLVRHKKIQSSLLKCYS